MKKTLFVFLVAISILFINEVRGEVLKFVQLSDVHISDAKETNSYKLLENSEELLKGAIEQVNEVDNVDFVMFTGDCVDKPKEESLSRFLAIAKAIKQPWFFAFGNHDVSVGGNFTKQKYMQMVKRENLNYVFDKSYYSFCPKEGFKVIVLDATISGIITACGHVPEEQLKWLDRELFRSGNDVILIFLHFPVMEPFKSWDHKIQNAEELIGILNKYRNPIGVFAGHYHTTRIQKCNNVIYVASPALISYPNAFRVVEVENNKDEVKFNFEFVQVKNLKLLKKAESRTKSPSLYYGRDIDRDCEYIIKK